MTVPIVTHRRSCKRKPRTLALIERDIYAIRTRVYVHTALRRYFQGESYGLTRMILHRWENARRGHD